MVAAPLEVHARRGVRGIIAGGGADFVRVAVRNTGGVARSGTVRVADGIAAPFRVAAGGLATVVLARPLPPRMRVLGPLAGSVRTNDGHVVDFDVPGAEVVDGVAAVVDEDPGFLAQLARKRGQLRGRAVLATPRQWPDTWLALRGVDTLFVRAGTAVRLQTRALAMGTRVCALTGQTLSCRGAMPRRGLRRYPAPASARPAMDRLASLALLGAAWLLLLALGWRYVPWRSVAVAAALVPVLVLVAFPAGRLAPASVAATGHLYRSGGAEAFVVARLRGRRGSSPRLPALGAGQLWLRPDASDARRGELRTFRPLAPDRFPDQRIWRVEGFVSVAAPPAWTAQLPVLVLDAEGS